MGAADALDEIGDARATKPLLQMLGNYEDSNVRLSVAGALNQVIKR